MKASLSGGRPQIRSYPPPEFKDFQIFIYDYAARRILGQKDAVGLFFHPVTPNGRAPLLGDVYLWSRRIALRRSRQNCRSKRQPEASLGGCHFHGIKLVLLIHRDKLVHESVNCLRVSQHEKTGYLQGIMEKRQYPLL